eukprot:TRINITY_DN6183_c0_g1_i1.p1 TRINITY_DN6183_c0_g1~~TRINITY_DN6183_c0_g1_i1.p1  ORF type:complete len:176 (-),score=30.10 TRINITY_DN6183_c0_g1_i1:125-652(-)
MARSKSACLVTAAVFAVLLSSMAFVQAPITARADRAGAAGRVRMRGAAAEDPAGDAPESSGSQAALGTLVTLGLIAGLLAPRGAVAVIDEVLSRSSQSPTVTQGVDSNKASIGDVKTEYVALKGKFNRQLPMETEKVGDTREAFEPDSSMMNRVQDNFLQASEQDWQNACYPGIC